MAIPIVPVALVAARYGAVALTAYLIARRHMRVHLDQRAEDTLDRVEEGVALNRSDDYGRMTGTARWRRQVFLRDGRAGLDIDATLLGRLKLRRIKR